VIDEKIELNKKINKKLEELARLLYEYYFVQFDFPDINGKPYKSSGGEMVYNEKLKRKIPKGWEVIELKECLNFIKGIEPGKKAYKETFDKNTVPFYKVGDLEKRIASTWLDKKFLAKCECKIDDILVSFDGSVGKVAFGLEGIYSSGIRKIELKDENLNISKLLLLMIFKSQEIQNTIKKYATGSNILHASESIKYLFVPYNKQIFELYNQQIKGIFEMLIQNQLQIQKLEKLRDFLLPMLLNGQVIISEKGFK
jgi:type I restriction enzyme S subunit